MARLKRVTFYRDGGNQYNPVTGRNEPVLTNLGTKTCHVMDLGAEKQNLLLGELDLKAISFYHLGKEIKADFVKIDSMQFKIRKSRQVIGKATYIGEEMRGKHAG